jgi:ubiquinone/menaquinone biosynthesis C-methylase UbiE
MSLGPFSSEGDIVDIAHRGERYVPQIDPYKAAMHLGHMASYKYALRFAYGRQVLDLGCGVGYGAHYLASYGASRVVAVDVDGVALDYARASYSHPCIHYQRCDGQRLPFADAAFEFVFSSQVIEHMPDTRAFLTEIKRVLKPQGACLITTPNKHLFSPDPAGGPGRFHISEMTPKQFELLGRGVFPGAQMVGIPQNSLQIQPDGSVRLKSNEELCLEDYQVQRENLIHSENILLWGYNDEAGGFPATLPESLSDASTNLGPCFWDATAKRWIELGLYPISRTADARAADDQQAILHPLRPRCDDLFRIDIALRDRSATPVEVILREGSQDGRVLVRKAVQPSGKRLCLVFQPITDSANREFLLEIGCRRRVLGRVTRRMDRLPQFEYRGGQIVLWTYHQTLPPTRHSQPS